MAFFKSLTTVMLIVTATAPNFGIVFGSRFEIEMRNQYENSQKINRGDFAQPRIDPVKLDEMDFEQLLSLNKSVNKEIVCNYMYNILHHLYLTIPGGYDFATSVTLYTHTMDKTCRWARNMVVHIFHSNIIHSHTDVFWLFYFYADQIRTTIVTEADRASYDELLRAMHSRMTKLMKKLLSADGCTMYGKSTEDVTDEFHLLDLERKTPDRHDVLKKLRQDYVQVEENLDVSTVVIDEEYFDLERLYLNNVVDNPDVMDALISEFVEIENGRELVKFMTANMNVVKGSQRLSLQHYVVSLYNFHECFVTLLNAIMLQLCVQHLTYLETRPQGSRSTEKESFDNYLEQYSSFIAIEGKYSDLYFGVIGKFKTKTELSNEKIAQLKLQVTDSLKKIRSYLQNKVNFNWALSFNSNNVNGSEIGLTNFAIRNGIRFKPKSTFSIKSAEIFVNYIEKKLLKVNFKLIRSVMNVQQSSAFYAYANLS